MEYVSSLSPKALVRSVTSAGAEWARSVSAAGTEVSRRVWDPAPPLRPFRVVSRDRTVRKGVMASTLKELMSKVFEVFMLVPCTMRLVLDEDGTSIDSEEFFSTLEDYTSFMVLQDKDVWLPHKDGRLMMKMGQEKPRQSKDIATVTFDIYKLSPRDLIGCLNIKATIYGMYSMSLDLRCLGAKKVLKEAMRAAAHIMQGFGRILLGVSSYMRLALESDCQSEPVVYALRQ
uniref:Cell death inducing DFFA like effector b n=1 Tax=Eptatretus burgeri TaxID=7764 RepID=A0A8C4N4T1_EPTBU